jgi:hypothetical protein
MTRSPCFLLGHLEDRGHVRQPSGFGRAFLGRVRGQQRAEFGSESGGGRQRRVGDESGDEFLLAVLALPEVIGR